MLRQGHSTLCGKPQAARSLLLHGAGGIGGGRVALALATLYLADLVAGDTHIRKDGVNLGLILQFDVIAINTHQASGIFVPAALRLKLGVNGPVFIRHKVVDFTLALNHQTQSHRLNPTGRQAAAHFAPQERTEIVTHQPIQHAARLLGIYQVHIDLARVGKSIRHSRFGDLVKDHPAGYLRIDLGRFEQMPGDGLPLPIRVSRQVNLLGFPGKLLEFFNNSTFLVGHPVFRLETVIHVNRKLGAQQIAHMPDRGLHCITLTQKPSYCFRLGGRFDHHQLARSFRWGLGGFNRARQAGMRRGISHAE